MHTHHFYSNDIRDQTVYLDEEETRHCNKVYRHKVGDHIFIMDGKGNRYKTEIISIDRKEVVSKILETEHIEDRRPYHLIVAMCLIKNMSRWEVFLEKAVELGAAGIIPIVSERTLKPSIKMRRMNHILMSACKQSEQFHMPKMYPLMTFDEMLVDDQFSDYNRCIAHVQNEKRPWLTEVASIGDIIVAIGPEGDFTRNEVDRALESGWKEISLGEQRLRTETAGILTCASLYSFNQ